MSVAATPRIIGTTALISGPAGPSRTATTSAPFQPVAAPAATISSPSIVQAPVAGVKVLEVKDGVERTVPTASLKEGGDAVARVAFQNAQRVNEFLRSRFNRNGWDGNGAALQVVVHAPGDDGRAMNNAYWDRDSGRIYVGDGDGKLFSPLGSSLDVMTHETVHAVVDSEVNLPYRGQAGGINESWADVLGALADVDHDWLIGEDIYTPAQQGDAIRDLANPRFGNLRQIPPQADVEVHDLSGIPSLAAVRVADRIGRDQMGQIWYRALCDHLDSRAGFAGAARATLDATVDLFGRESSQFSAVMDAWKSVGVNPRYRIKP